MKLFCQVAAEAVADAIADRNLAGGILEHDDFSATSREGRGPEAGR